MQDTITFITNHKLGTHIQRFDWCKDLQPCFTLKVESRFLADCTNGHAYATLLRPSVCNVCIVAKRWSYQKKLSEEEAMAYRETNGHVVPSVT